jgi:hypothetical protein
MIFPEEITNHIHSFLDGTSKIMLRMTSKRYNEMKLLYAKIYYKPKYQIYVDGHIDLLKITKKKFYGDRFMRCAVEGGNIHMVKFLKPYCEWHKNETAEAAENGHPELLKYLHENGCPWDERVCMHAASRNDMKMLLYARQNGCKWDYNSTV